MKQLEKDKLVSGPQENLVGRQQRKFPQKIGQIYLLQYLHDFISDFVSDKSEPICFETK